MKRILIAITLLFIALQARAATGLSSVLVTNINALDFSVNLSPTNAVTNIVKMNLSRSQFREPVLPGDVWTITNISGVFGGSTNIITNSIWGIDGSGTISPTVTNNAVLATNVVRVGNGVMSGTETWYDKSIVLTNGVNYLPAGQHSQFQLISPSVDPSLVQIVLSNGVQAIQRLEIFNLTNAVPSQGGFTLTNGTPIPDSLASGVVKLIGGENWVATNGCGIEFRFIPPDWVEQFRSDVSGNPTFITNYYNNVVIYSNLTAKVIRINNVLVNEDALWRTNVTASSTNIQPQDLNLQPVIKQGLMVGTNSITHSPGPLTNGEALFAWNDVAAGDPDNLGLTIAAQNGGEYSKLYLLGNSTQGDLVGRYQNGGNSYMHVWEWGNSNLSYSIQNNGNYLTLLQPTTQPGVVPYRLDTLLTHSSSNLLELANNTTNRFSVDWNGIARANKFYAVNNLSDTPGSTNGLILSSAGTMFAYMNSLGTTIAPSYGLSLWNITDATVGSTNQYSPPLWWKGSWYDTAPRDLRVGLFLKASTDYASSKLTMLSSTNNLSTFLTNFSVSANSGYDGTGNLFLSSDGTYKSAGGGSGGTNTITSLTPAAPQTITFNITNGITQWLVATGQVTIASSGLAAAAGFTLNIDNQTATNINVITPIGWHPISGAGVSGTTIGTNILAAGKIGILSAFSRAANDTNVVSTWQSE